MGCKGRKRRRALMGHSIVLFAAIRTVTPCRKGSVLEALMCRWAWSLRMLTSPSIRVVVGSNLVVWEDVYSDILKKPKNAVMMAVHSITLSSYKRRELNRFRFIIRRREGVMGSLFGRDLEVP